MATSATPLGVRQFATIDALAPPSDCPSSPKSASGPPAFEVQESISLTEDESRIFETLLAAAAQRGTGTILRCAGGWVRDKLLGRASADIDIAIDNAMGRDFADSVNTYLASQGQQTRTTAVIQSNPDQSKHLETARMKIHDLWIDLVNLRSETYASDSRIPEMQLGTPQEDAMRRDFTVNSLFYNLNEKKVEDFTGRGIQDLKDGLIRTPLHPLETFRDDPLRALRAVRFSARFGFRLDDEILKAAADEEIQDALAKKVSKERIGTELEGMFNGPDPVRAVRLLEALGLFRVIFALPAPLDVSPLAAAPYGRPCVANMAAVVGVLSQLQESRQLGKSLTSEERRFILLAALLLPLRGLTAAAAKGKTQSASAAIIRSGIKWRVKDIEACEALHAATAAAAGVVEKVAAGGTTNLIDNNHSNKNTSADGEPASEGAESLTRLEMGRLIRTWKQHWRLALVLAPMLNYLGGAGDVAEALVSDPRPEALKKLSDPLSEQRMHEEVAAKVPSIAEAAGKLIDWVEKEGLGDCWQWKPLLNGKQIMDLLGWTKPGPAMGRVAEAAMDWQIQNPSGSVEECGAFIKETFGNDAAAAALATVTGGADNRKRKQP